jgi:hypothetical protein
MLPALLVLLGVIIVSIWWMADDALSVHRARQREAQRQAVVMARINLLSGGAQQALREEALLHRLAELDFNRLSDRL